mgnify:CR=1 FL=1
MRVLPAIDLMGGRAVRLLHGLAETRQDYGDPLLLAERYAAAELLHVVDLDGAFAGAPRQLELIARLAARPIQVGGGLRTEEDVQRLLDAGAARVVLGTVAVKQPQLLDRVLERHGPERLCVAVDVRDGEVAIRGWTAGSGVTPEAIAERLEAQGVRHVLCTAVHRDGTLEGPDLSTLARVQRPGLQIQASGGIGCLEHVRSVSHMAGVIVGKALLEGRFTLEEALAC